MNDILNKIAVCVEYGKLNRKVPYPPFLKEQDGVDELTQQALATGISQNEILTAGLITGMNNIGVKFKDNKVFVPQVLMSAKAMSIGMGFLKKYFADGSVKRKGKFIIGTVEGDLHDIGKNLVFVAAVKENPDAFVGMSALLTTTMVNMEKINVAIKEENPCVITFAGGAPVSEEFAKSIGIDYYTEEPQALVEILDDLVSRHECA